jgi:hypothetical protein
MQQALLVPVGISLCPVLSSTVAQLFAIILKFVADKILLRRWKQMTIARRLLSGYYRHPSMYGATASSGHWPPLKISSIRSLFSALLLNQTRFLIARSSPVCRSHPTHLWGFLNVRSFTGCGSQPHPQPPTWRTRV